jgi:hypothetical protein
MPHFREEPHFFDEVFSLDGIVRGKNALIQSAAVIGKRFHAHSGLKSGVRSFLG